MGYPLHKWLAIGHLAEASEEIYYIDSTMAHKIRQYRKLYEEDGQLFPVMELLDDVTKLENHTASPQEQDGA